MRFLKRSLVATFGVVAIGFWAATADEPIIGTIKASASPFMLSNCMPLLVAVSHIQNTYREVPAAYGTVAALGLNVMLLSSQDSETAKTWTLLKSGHGHSGRRSMCNYMSGTDMKFFAPGIKPATGQHVSYFSNKDPLKGCMPSDTMRGILAQNFGQTLVAQGKYNDTIMIEVYATHPDYIGDVSDRLDDEFALLATLSQGTSCTLFRGRKLMINPAFKPE